MKFYKNLFDQIISLENIFSAWDAFKSDKRKKADVIEFEWHLEESIFKLHRELKNKTYKHGRYSGFYIQFLFVPDRIRNPQGSDRAG